MHLLKIFSDTESEKVNYIKKLQVKSMCNIADHSGLAV
jgi:hypothetical protein